MDVYFGIDNGVSGSVGTLTVEGDITTSEFMHTPVGMEQDYTKKKKNISRIDMPVLYRMLKKEIRDAKRACVCLERPMVNPKRFQASASALRALEATLIVIQLLTINRKKKNLDPIALQYVDSKEWQKMYLTKGIKGASALKENSMVLGLRRFPQHEAVIRKQKDADGLWLAEFCKVSFR